MNGGSAQQLVTLRSFPITKASASMAAIMDLNSLGMWLPEDMRGDDYKGRRQRETAKPWQSRSLLKAEDPPTQEITEVISYSVAPQQRQPWEAHGPPHLERYLVSVCSV